MSQNQISNAQAVRDSMWTPLLAVVLTALAAGTGWGIRGQYGHETGAMIVGVLASLTLVLLVAPHLSSLRAARAAAMMTVGIGIGGSMTYGQTVGLTHDHEIQGNWEALRWGMLGLAIKGGVWIGFGGALLGMGLSDKRYRPLEMAMLMVGLLALFFAGVYLINSPFDPANKKLPFLYFSDHWYFEPNRELKHRPELWGGFVLALCGLAVYCRAVRGDRLAARMAGIAFVAGALGFPGGQAIQASHAWNPELYTDGALSFLSGVTKYFNWWNVMETTFGTIWGGVVAIGLWMNRRLIDSTPNDGAITMTPTWEVALLVTHLCLLLSAHFLSDGPLAKLEWYVEIGILMSAIPLIGIVGGRLWPYMMLLPVAAIPICGKTAKIVCDGERFHIDQGWLLMIGIPISVLLVLATWLITQGIAGQRGNRLAAIALIAMSWLFFSLNTLVFDFAWPWNEWGGRTPNQLFFSVSTIALTIAAVVFGSRRVESS